jgi:hypothetical protein
VGRPGASRGSGAHMEEELRMRGEVYTVHKNRNTSAQYAETGSASCTLACTTVHDWISLAAVSNDAM